ncbi:ABC transporter ATP-binding protein [Alsobacter sp. R-9]
MTAQPLLIAEKVRVLLGSRVAVQGIDLRLSRGEFACVVGPNGAGKTTLLRALAGLVAHEGSVQVGVAPVRGLRPAERARRVAYLPQSGAVSWPLPVRDVVALGRMPHGARIDALAPADLAIVADAIARTGLEGFETRLATALSGGERARVLLARALAVEADVLLADEPVASLDPRHQLAIMGVLRAEARRGRAVVAVLHDLALAARYADRIVMMEDGAVVADGSPRDVLDSARIAAVFGIDAITEDRDGRPLVIPWSISRR